MQTDYYDAQGNLITETQNSPGTSTPAGSGGSGGSGSGAPGAAGKDGAPGSVTYFVNFEPTPGQQVSGYNPQDNLFSPSGILYSLKSA